MTNEREYPNIAALFVADDKMDVELNRRMMDFHRLGKGRRTVREG
jgi:hypothetical protein